MTSRQKLYAAGLPLGDGATRAKLGGGYVCGGGGDSTSKQESNNYDQRVAVQDGVGLSSSNGNFIDASRVTTYNVTDSGIVSRGLQTVDTTVKGAFDAIKTSSATNAEGFTKLLDLAGDMFNRSEGLIGQTQKSVADAYSTAKADANGTIDNRTIMVIAVAGLAAFAYANKRG